MQRENFTCVNCGRSNNRGGRTCSRCYMAAYRKTAAGKQASRKALKRYETKHPEKRAQWVQTYRERSGYYTPQDVHDIRRACKRLEQALATSADS